MDIAWRPASPRPPGDARLGHRTSASTPLGRARERIAPQSRPRVAAASMSTLERTKHLSPHRYHEKSPKPWSAARRAGPPPSGAGDSPNPPLRPIRPLHLRSGHGDRAAALHPFFCHGTLMQQASSPKNIGTRLSRTASLMARGTSPPQVGLAPSRRNRAARLSSGPSQPPPPP